MDILQLILMVLVGFIAGVISSTVGGAALINAPFLLILGLQPVVAIATGRFSLLSSLAVGGTKYYRSGLIKEKKLLVTLILVGVIGSLIGARIALSLDQQVLKILVVIVSTLVLLVMFFKKDIGSESRKIILRRNNYIINTIVIFLLSLYSGFFGPGAGVFILFAFAYLFGFTYLKSSAFMTTLNIFVIGTTSLFFAFHGAIDYEIGIPLLIGNAVGGYVGSHFAMLRGNTFIKPFFFIVSSILIIRLVFDILGGK